MVVGYQAAVFSEHNSTDVHLHSGAQVVVTPATGPTKVQVRQKAAWGVSITQRQKAREGI